ncbi:hypothetical protein MMC12_006750, partial [Toensbergia leucococca]|nr:hypothetical protein [Toensbergia leucococca]
MAKAARKYRAMTKALSELDAIIVATSLKVQTIVEASSEDLTNPKVKRILDDLSLLHVGLKKGLKHVEDALKNYPVLQGRIFTHGENVRRTG